MHKIEETKSIEVKDMNQRWVWWASGEEMQKLTVRSL